MGTPNDQWQDFGHDALSAYADDWKDSPVLYEEVVETENNSYNDELRLPTPIPSPQEGMMFGSFKEFQEVFQPWNTALDHRFRIRSSHPFWNSDGTKDKTFQYRQMVYQCAHYGKPRFRGEKPRPLKRGHNATGCKATLHLNFDRRQRTLVITKLNEIHTNHERSPQLQEDNDETSQTNYATEFDFNEQQLQQLYDFDSTDNLHSDEGQRTKAAGSSENATQHSSSAAETGTISKPRKEQDYSRPRVGLIFTCYEDFLEKLEQWSSHSGHKFSMFGGCPRLKTPNGTWNETIRYESAVLRCKKFRQRRNYSGKTPGDEQQKAKRCRAKIRLRYRAEHEDLILVHVYDRHAHHDHEGTHRQQDQEAPCTSTRQERRLDNLQTFLTNLTTQRNSDEGVASVSGGQPDDITSET